MATVNQYVPERRHIPERRVTVKSTGMQSTHIMNAVDWIAMVLLFIGGLNWGLIGLFNLNVVEVVFGEASIISRAIYVLVGLSALYSIYTASKMSSSNTTT